MNVLEVQHITKRFGDFIAVDDISFSLKKGEILGFLGPNGAGKTTTIQMLLSVLTPTSGSILYFGKNLEQYRSDIMERVNFSSTYTNLPWTLTVKENLTFIAYLYNIKDRKDRLEKVTETFKLSSLLDQKISELSAGQLTRVNLAKAFVNMPEILLLDEPTASLDVDIAKYVRDFLLEERRKQQLSIIITSHNMTEVEQLCDRVIVINHGKVVADDSPEVLARSLRMSHVELYIKKGVDKLATFCKEQAVHYRVDGKEIIIDVETKAIPSFLRTINELDIFYDEISIQKPNLENFFLDTVKKEN